MNAMGKTVSETIDGPKLAALDQRRFKSHDFKQGTMQEFLPGGTRLV